MHLILVRPERKYFSKSKKGLDRQIGDLPARANQTESLEENRPVDQFGCGGLAGWKMAGLEGIVAG
jgi:hypothetical protein